jgi:chromosome segregation ATPase
MPRLYSTLLALALATAVAAPAWAQQVTTSKGVRTLMRTDGFKSEWQYRQAARAAEEVLVEIMQDINASESARGTANADAAGFEAKVKKANQDYATAQAAYDKHSQQYRDDVAAFEQRQSALTAERQQLRADADAQLAKAEVDRDYAVTARLNERAARLNQTQAQLDGERARLAADRERVEQERANLAKQRTEAEAKLKQSRDATVGDMKSSATSRVTAYRNLNTTVSYLRKVRDGQAVLSGKPASRSDILDQATDKLRRYQATAPAAKN